MRKVTDCLDLTDRTAVAFLSGTKMIVGATLRDEADFRKWVEAASSERLKELGDGAYGIENSLIIKDGFVWGGDDITLADIEGLADLGDKSFAATHEKMAAEMCESDRVLYGFADINRLLSYGRMAGALEQVSAIQLVLGTAFKDASYITLSGELDDDGAEGEMTVLNSDYQPAEFLIPMGGISDEALARVNGDAFVVAAIDFSPEMMKMLGGLAGKYASGLNPMERAAVDVVLGLSGTSACSVDGPESIMAAIGFKDNAAASAAGEMLSAAGARGNVHASDNYLMIRSAENLPAGGKAPAEFSGNFFGMVVDYAAPGARTLLPADLGAIGKVTVVLGPDGKGIRLKSTWKAPGQTKTPAKILVGAMNNVAASGGL